MEAVGAEVAVDELVNDAGVAVECEDHIGPAGEDIGEGERIETVGKRIGREEAHQVDDVHEPDAQVGHERPQ